MLGNADDIVRHLCNELGWDLPQPPPPSSTPVSSHPHLAPRPINMNKRPSSEVIDRQEPQRVGDRRVMYYSFLFRLLNNPLSHVWLFEGAEGGRWVQQLEENLQANSANLPSQVLNGVSEPEAKRLRVT